MKNYVVYDSFFGNTEQIAKQIASKLQNVQLVKVKTTTSLPLKAGDLLVLGSPTRAFTYSPNIKAFIKNHAKLLKGVNVAVFDTRMDVTVINNKFLTFMTKRFGYAAKKLEKALLKKGATLKHSNTWFFVKESKGPLFENEMEKATAWALNLK